MPQIAALSTQKGQMYEKFQLKYNEV